MPAEDNEAATKGKGQVISIDDFDLIRVIGRGSYAKVLMVELKKTRRIYAMKVIKKEMVTDDEDIDWVQTEKHVFETASNHPFLVGLHSCFQTNSRYVKSIIDSRSSFHRFYPHTERSNSSYTPFTDLYKLCSTQSAFFI